MDGAYNFRIIQYANGSVEIRKYSSPVNAIYTGEITVEPVYKKPKKRESQKEYNPFTDEVERLPTFEESERSRTREVQSKIFTNILVKRIGSISLP